MISAQVVADSQNEFGNRITTMVVTMPRIILAEFNTHRMFSRNTASSRAIPFKKMLETVENNPFVPIAWQKDHRGMQGVEYQVEEVDGNIEDWLMAMNYAVKQAIQLNEIGVTKQICNRLLEPFTWVTAIVTATEWENFFALRCPRYELTRITKLSLISIDPVNGSIMAGSCDSEQVVYRSRKDLLKEHTFKEPMNDLQWLQINKGQAEIHMMALAEAMYDAYQESTPKQLKAGEWHIPFEDKCKEAIGQFQNYHTESLVKISTVMAARTSYTVVGEDQKPLSYQRMIEIHDQLLAANPKHMSPFEHCAKAMDWNEGDPHNGHPSSGGFKASEARMSGNFKGFIQYRKTIKGENITV